MTARPLCGLRVIELGGIGPGPHAAMLLTDWGADVVRIERPRAAGSARRPDPLLRGQRIIELDLKTPEGQETLLSLVPRAHVLIEGFRPGVLERLGLGPEESLRANPQLVFARMTGWGQDGPLSRTAGHDINFLALSGALHAMGRAGEAPTPPLNLVGDYGGGSVMLVAAILAAVRQTASASGQVIDMAIIDGTSLLLQLVWSMRDAGAWTQEREANLLDGGAPFYRSYRCGDERFVAVGAIEPAFYALLLEGLGLPAEMASGQNDRSCWPAARELFTSIFLSRDRDEWAALFEGTDACVTPVLSLDEAAAHPQVGGRSATVVVAGIPQAGMAPRFSGSPTSAVPVASGTALLAAAVLASWSGSFHPPQGS